MLRVTRPTVSPVQRDPKKKVVPQSYVHTHVSHICRNLPMSLSEKNNRFVWYRVYVPHVKRLESRRSKTSEKKKQLKACAAVTKRVLLQWGTMERVVWRCFRCMCEESIGPKWCTFRCFVLLCREDFFVVERDGESETTEQSSFEWWGRWGDSRTMSCCSWCGLLYV